MAEELTAYKEYQLVVDKEHEEQVQKAIEGRYTFVSYEGMYVDAADLETVDSILVHKHIPFSWGAVAVNIYKKDSDERVMRSYVDKGRTLLIDVLKLTEGTADVTVSTRSGERWHQKTNGTGDIPIEVMGAFIDSIETYPGGMVVYIAPVTVIKDGRTTLYAE